MEDLGSELSPTVYPCLALVTQLLIKNGLILPIGQWYAPSAVINDTWYCMELHGIALYCMVLQGIAFIALYCMVLHGIA